ncbi:hypothetical protein [Shinella granuli]|uniref:Uncharacterized protein n=1 Tax=Shinella granuli TaxID=323621 RepID=A0A4R2D237_SHIGR|nr:hypothetical protein [Shinella granuli]TCN47803.1 hypothetical protein EV665_102323 [Shinella granuli]
MRFLPALAFGLSVLSPAAYAEEAATCPAKPVILAFSDTVLADREKLPRLKARGFGAEAAYLKMRYGGLSMDEAAALAHGLRDAGVREAIDLAGAIDATRDGFDTLGDADPVQLNGLISTVRAILLHGDGEKLLAAIASLPPERQVSLSGRIVPAIADRPDEEKAKLAASAGRHKLFFLQAGLVASQRDPNAWPVFVAGFPDTTRLADLTRLWSWAPALVGNPALPRLPVPDAAAQATQKSLHTVWLAAAKEPERDFLMTYVNQTGDIASTAKAAEAVLAEITAGRITPEGLLDPAWLVAYRALRAAGPNPAVVDTTLEIMSINTRRVVPPTSNVSIRDLIDRAVAIDALAPYLAGKSDVLPDRPTDISPKFQAEWPLWVELSRSLKSVPLTPLAKDPLKAPVIAELLFAAGDHARLADFVLAVEPTETKLAIATDFAMRLDRGCQSHMHHPAEALLLAGQPIFKFDPAQ